MASTPEPPSHPLPKPTPTVPTNPSGSVFLGYGNPPQFPTLAASPGWPSRLVSPRPARSWSPGLLPRRPWLTLSVPGLFIGPGWSTHRRAPILPWLPPSLGRSCPRKGPGPCLLPHPQTHHFLDPPLASAPSVGLIRRCFLDPPMTLTRMCAEVTLKQPRHALCPPWSVSPTPLPPVCHGTCSP